MKKIVHLLMVFVFFFSLGLPLSYGAEGDTSDYIYEISTKFGRGVMNVVSSPFEIFCRTAQDMEDQGATGFFTGMGKGFMHFGHRLLVGVMEVGTFVIPMPPDLPSVCEDYDAGIEEVPGQV